MATDKVSDKKATDKAAVLEAIAAMPDADRVIGEQLHALIEASAPALMPRTWYGMPAYTNGDKIICFFRSRKKFGERFMTLGFNDTANLDEGAMWPIYFAIQELTPVEAAKISALVKKAAS